MNTIYNPEAARIVAVIPDLVSAGDLDKIEDVLIDAIPVMTYEAWDDKSTTFLKALRDMPAEQRSELIAGMSVRLHDVPESLSDTLNRLFETLSDGLDEEFLVWLREVQLSYAAAFYEYVPLNRPIEWAAEISAGGGSFSSEEIALIRRHQQIPIVKRNHRKQFIHFAEPVLNGGEAWTDKVLAELPDLGENWRRLVDHAKTANSTRPSATWDRKATAMLAAIGHPEATRRLTSWLRQVPSPRTVKLELPPFHKSAAYDRFNVVAACGLVWTASLLPADPDLTEAIGGLVKPATVKVSSSEVRSLKLAGAAVFGLERIPGQDADCELERLEDKVVHGSVLQRIRVARALRR